MKNFNIKNLFLVYLLVIVLPITVFASDNIALEVDKTDLEAGDVVTVKANLPLDTKLYALTATLSYDHNVFESLDESSFIADDETLNILYNASNNKFGLINKKGAISEYLFSVKLKVKDNATVGDTYIGLTNITASDGDSKIYYAKQAVKVMVTKDATENDVVTNNKPYEVEDKDEPVLKTFSSKPLIIFFATVLSVFLVAAIYITITKKTHLKLIISLASITGLLLVTFITFLLFVDNKKDVNNDGNKTYDDAEEILRYLLDFSGSEESINNENSENNNGYTGNTNNYNNPENTSKEEEKDNNSSNNTKPSHDKNDDYDVNNDGKVDIEDVGDTTEHVTENVNYQVTLSEKNNNIYLPKGNYTLELIAKVTNNEPIKEIYIDNEKYKVLKHDNYYSIEIKTPDVAGVHEFKITKVVLENERVVNTSLTLKKEILKDAPYVDMFRVDDEHNTLSFKLEDKDNAFISGNVLIESSANEIIINEELQEENNFNYEFKKDLSYNITVTADYDLDSNKLNNITGEQNKYQEKVIYHHTFTIDDDYNFKLSNIMISDAISKNEELLITFDSTNSNNYPVEYIVVDDKEYDVIKIENDNHYTVALTGYNTSLFGRFELDIEKVALQNLKVFEKDKDYKSNVLIYSVLKEAPNVTDIKLSENKSAKEINVTYNLKDEDKTLEKLDVVLTDSTGKIISKKEDVKENSLALSYAGSSDGRYTVKFLADCNLGTDRHIYTAKNIGEDTILTQKDIYISKVNVTSIYPTKNQEKYTITYKIEATDEIKKASDTVNYNKVSAITINGLNYSAEQTKNPFESYVSFTIPKEAGILDIVASRVQLQFENYNINVRNYFSVEPYKTQIDVLKDKPWVENIRITNEDYEKGSVTFKFDVKEDKGGFISGYLELDNQTHPIVSGENTITFDGITKDKELELKFYADYDLDSNSLPNEDFAQNRYSNQVIHSMKYTLIANEEYNKINLTNITLDSEYYEKHQKINLSFNSEESSLNLDIAKLIVNNKEIDVTKKDNLYKAVLDAYSSWGLKEILIKEVILSNGKRLTLANPLKLNVTILKTPPTINDYAYKVNDKEIIITTTLTDNDQGTNDNNLQVIVYDEDNNILEEKPYSSEIKIKRKDDIYRYYIKVIAKYDLDNVFKGDNYYENVTLLDKVISLEKNYIEVKDITDVKLFKQIDNNIELVENVNITDLKNNLSAYYVEVTMKEMPTMRFKIKEVLNENNHLIFVLDSKYTTKNKEAISIDFGTINGDEASNEISPETFASLVARIAANPSGEFVLTHDYDASGYITDSDTIINMFTGTLDGQGHSIKNLNKPLFYAINDGKVENLILNKVILSNKPGGALAIGAFNAKINNVLVDDFTKYSSEGSSGSLVGKAGSGTEINNCKATRFNISIAWPSQQVGGLVGNLNNSSVNNSYAIGTISGGFNFVAGLVGNVDNTGTVTNSYAKVSLSGNGNITCGLACVYTGSLNLKNNISLSTGFANFLANKFKTSQNNYQVNNTSGVSEQEGITNIIRSEVNKSLFKDRALFDDSIWNLSDISYDNPPIFVNEIEHKIDIDSVKDIYDEEREIIYNNLMLLMPFYDINKIITSGNTLSKTDILNEQEIRHIVPIDKDGHIVTYLTTDNPSKITAIKVVFKNGDKRKYEVRYENNFDMVANYRITHLKIDYTFNHYLIDSNSQLINNLTNYLASLSYEDNLDILTATSDSRIYKEFYEDVTKKELKEFVLKYLASGNYTNTSSDLVINDYLEKELKKDQKLEKALYVYNYFRRFYHIDIEGIMLDDLILFNFQGFGKDLTPDGIANLYLSNEANFNLNSTSDAYDRTLAKYTNIKSIPKLLEYYVKTLTWSNQTMSEWFAHEYKGLLKEIKVAGRDDILYTIWDHISYEDHNGRIVWYNFALPILTLPENSSYIISTPTQFLIGSLRTYVKDPNDETLMKEFIENKFNVYTARMETYFNTAAGILVDEKYFNEIHGIQIDKRYTYDENGNYIFQTPYVTEEPFHKNFNEVVGAWAHADGNAATSNGTYIYWRAEAALDGEWTYATWSHETAHNVDARLFLKNNGRRYDAGGEDYADGNLSQRFNESDIVMNLSVHFDGSTNIAANYAPERINTPEKIQSFYRKLFETVYLMDYIEAKAFLKLTPLEQSKLAVQASYPNENKEDVAKYLWYKYTLYQQLDEETFTNMNLQSIENLYDNHLVIYPGVIYSTVIDNRYGTENILKARWYQPHNDYGRPDSYSIKWFAYEMLGLKGYDNGYIEYYSNIHANSDGSKTDLMALRTILGDETATFKSYKLNRFKETAEKIKYVQNINVDDMYKKLLKA